MATNRSQIYIETVDNTSTVLQGIARQVQTLQTQMAGINSAGFSRVNASLTTQTGLLTNIRDSLLSIPGDIANIALKWVGVLGAIALVKTATTGLFNLYAEGVKINIDTETTKIGIAGLIATVYTLKKGTQEITGMDKLNTSLLLSDRLMKRLRISAIETGASFDDVVEAFRNAVGGGAQLGIGPEKLEKLSSLMANAIKGFALPAGQAGQETRAIFSGTIDRTSTVGKALELGPGQKFQNQYQAALKKGGDAFSDFLQQRLEQFENAGKVYASTVGGIFDQLSDSYKLYKGDIASGLSEELLKVKKIADSLFSKGDFTTNLDGLTATLQTIGKLIGESLVNGFKGFIDLVFQFSNYLLEDQSLLNDILSIIGSISSIFGNVFEIVGNIFSVIIDCVRGVMGVSDGASTLDIVMYGVVTTVGAFALALQGIKGIIIILGDLIKTVLGGAIDFVSSSISGILKTLGGIQQSIANTKVGNAIGLDGKLGGKLINQGNSIEASAKSRLATIAGDKNVILNEKDRQEFINNFNKETAILVNKINQGGTQKNNEVQKQIQKLLDSRKKLADLGVGTSSSGKTPKEKGSGGDPMNAILKSYEDELKAFKDGNEFKRKENDLLYNNFKKNVQDYYNIKTGLDESDFNKQQEIYQKELDFLATQEGTKKGEKKNLEVENKITEITTKKLNSEKEYQLRKQETLFLIDKELRKQEQLLFGFKGGIDDLLGNSLNGNKIKLQIEIENLKIENQQNPEMLGLIDIYNKIKTFKLEQEQVNQMLSLSEEKLNILRENGSLTTIDYYKEMGKLNSERLAQYESELKLIKELAPDEQDNVRIKELQNLILKTRADLDPLAKDIKKTFQESFGTFFSDVISGTKSIKDAFKDLVSSISNYLSKLVSEKLAQQIFGGGDSSGLLGGLVSSKGSSGGGFIDFLSTGLSSLFGGGKATGGFTEPGKFYKWNENGDEMFFSNSGGFVMNASRTNDLLKGGGSGVTNVNVTLATPNYSSFNNSEGQVGAMISNALRKAQRNL